MSNFEIRRIDTRDQDAERALQALLRRNEEDSAQVEKIVADIIAQVRRYGDAAVLRYTQELDQVNIQSVDDLRVSDAELQAALGAIEDEARQALEDAAAKVDSYHQRQRLQSWEYNDPSGNQLGQRITPIQTVGIYVPGGKAAYPSSVLMNAVPAKIAGVEKLIMTVPAPQSKINPLVLAAAALVGVDQVFRIGGAQAVAAMAFGTDTVPAVDKIVGPGNAYVAAAKKQVFGKVGIDMVAGPSEVLVVADDSVEPEWVAMDLLAQAEHDERAQSILVSDDEQVLTQVEAALSRLLPTLERAEIAGTALVNQGAMILVENLQQACEIINRVAPEHLELMVRNPEAILEQVRNAGAIFVGPYSAEALGDYCAGPNHVLPTSGSARFSSPLGVYDFQKRSSLIRCSRSGANQLAEIASTLARAERLTAHARAAEYRMK